MSTTAYLPKKQRTRVGLIGFGKAGRAVASVLLNDKTIDLVWVVRKTHTLENRSAPEFLGINSDEKGTIHWMGDMDFKSLYASSPVDAIIDFSSETGMDYYAKDAAEYGITIVSAISNLPDDRIKKLREFSENSRILWSPNITLGINFLIIAAKTLQNIAPDADVAILEEHFKLKPEISGTALKIADALDIPQSSINTVRAGGIIGVHEILFGFPFQTVRLKHESISREAFGNGAIFALKELQKHELGFYNMEELVGQYFVDANMKYKKSIKSPKKLRLINRIFYRIIQRIKHT